MSGDIILLSLVGREVLRVIHSSKNYCIYTKCPIFRHNLRNATECSNQCGVSCSLGRWNRAYPECAVPHYARPHAKRQVLQLNSERDAVSTKLPDKYYVSISFSQVIFFFASKLQLFSFLKDGFLSILDGFPGTILILFTYRSLLVDRVTVTLLPSNVTIYFL
jgi:hypothetical protein